MIKRPKVKKPSFSGHESFPLRYAWLKKGYDALLKDPAVFSRDSAMIDLGVGKNMVRSIRHWGITVGLWTPRPEARGRDVEATELGRRLLDEAGWDPYMDDIGTVWLVHWLLASNAETATCFWLLFSRQKPGVVTKDDLEAELREIAGEAEGGREVPDSTLERDVGVTVRCYTRARIEKDESAEDAINSPLMALGLVRPVEGQRSTYVAPLAAHPSLPQTIFDAALIHWCAARSEGKQRAIPFEEVLYGWGSPGRVFRLHEAALMDRLSISVQRREPALRFDETAGVRQVLVGESLPSWLDVLAEHYTPSPDSEAR